MTLQANTWQMVGSWKNFEISVKGPLLAILCVEHIITEIYEKRRFLWPFTSNISNSFLSDYLFTLAASGLEYPNENLAMDKSRELFGNFSKSIASG